MERVPAGEVLAHRVVWTLIFLAAIVTIAGRWRELAACFRSPLLLVALAASSLLIAANWFVYLLCVEQRRIVHASLGYFLTPLVSVMLGMIVFRERLRRLQALALVLAVAGVARLLVEADDVPWLGLTLALLFGLYSLVRKVAPVDGLLGLSVETILLLPIAVIFLLLWHQQEALTFGTVSVGLDVFIAAGGIVTAVPLMCFGQAARRLPLTTLGFLQYLSPSLQFLLGVAFGEPFTAARATCFGLIWAALALFSYDSWRAGRRVDPSEVLQDV
jgi:chloramphenicol-sensitive protein RarD